MSKRKALITGATSGIGLATAKTLAENNFDIIICGRRLERLKSLQDELSSLCEVKILSFDVSRSNEVKKAINSLPDDWKVIDVLVNNAGNAHGLSPIQDGSIEDWDAMIDINVKGLLYMTKEVIPGMVERERGHVVNIGSIAGKEVYANGNVYCASKHAVDAINKGMLLDLNAYNIKVTSINPGLVETEFSKVRFKGDEERANNVYKGFDPLVAQDIADTILFVVTRPAHVNISDLTIFPTAQASATTVNKSK
ncbi:SDR family NAD(P)-dependent oxidoreductase [Fulvivirga ligni]|uniref:SDR family NAD(P)-dependent oxidoreductase n=1 Tax=Fulvivirga ligni TaxID=2904246 RepID=UPI001F351E01|nr:SDR family NAD(P)-dependent oxidoreductase [Fulvivirga ligni]UII23088.1 SDR family NAD(P)-dependent oxidoreductase [Fulvivirga ligni]